MLYDNLLRVGMLVKGPGVKQGVIVSSPVGTIDLAATFCEYAGTTMPDNAQSKSMVPLLAEGRPIQSHIYNEWNLAPVRAGVSLELRTIRTETVRLTGDLISGEGELYDLSSDSDELNNLWNDSSAKELREELMECVHNRPGVVAENMPEHTE